MSLKTNFVFLTLFAAASVTYASPAQHSETVSLKTFVNRFLFPDFAAMNGMTPTQLQKMISGSGAFYCGGEGGGATLIMRDNLIVTAAHLFLKHDKDGNCIGRVSDEELAKCQFRTLDGNGNVGGVAYYIDPKTLRMGNKCAMPRTASEDWAVVELKKVVPGNRHCDLFDVKSRGGRRTNDYADLKSMNVLLVSPFNANFWHDGALLDKPTICSSNIGHFEAEFDSNNQIRYVQGMHCHVGKGNSGGAIIVPQAERCQIIGFDTGGQGYSDPGDSYVYSDGPLIEGPFSQFLESCREHCPEN